MNFPRKMMFSYYLEPIFSGQTIKTTMIEDVFVFKNLNIIGKNKTGTDIILVQIRDDCGILTNLWYPTNKCRKMY